MDALKHPSLMKNLVVHSIHEFTFVRSGRGKLELVADLSEIQPQRVYNDACDLGILIKGNTTRLFTQVHECCPDGELTSIVLRCDDLPNVEVVLFND